VSSLDSAPLHVDESGRIAYLTMAVNWLVASFAVLVLLLYFGLIGLGQWQGDEYADFDALRTRGWHFFVDRMQWSPRPISETLLWIYGWTVNQMQQPLTVPFLGLLWAVFIVAGLVTFFQSRRERSGEDNWSTLAGSTNIARTISRRRWID
jgi:hypothetical protein